MKKIPLSQNQFAIVDDEDHTCISQWKWSAAWKHLKYIKKLILKETCP